MKTIYPFIFQTKSSTYEEFTSIVQEGYFEIVKSIIGENFRFEIIPSFNKYNSIGKIPIKNELDPSERTMFDEIIILNIHENKEIICNNKFCNDDIILFFDISSIGKETMIFSLLRKLSAILENDNKSMRVIILIDRLEEALKLTMACYDDYFHGNKIILFDKNGKFANKTFSNCDILNFLKLLTPSPTELIKNKMITQLGHFVRNENEKICFRTYFDGQYCTTEILEYTQDFISKNLKSKPFIIIHTSRNSSWLGKIMYAISKKTEYSKRCISIEYEDFSRTTITSMMKKLGNFIDIVFIVDLLNTGNTFKQNLGQINGILYNINGLKFNLHLLSIMNDKREQNIKRPLIRYIPTSNSNLRIDYMLDVNVKHSHIDDCELCKIGIPRIKFEKDYKDTLSSYVFWELCHNYDYIKEKYVPNRPDRQKIEWVPNVAAWIADNGPFLAYKFKKMLDAHNIKVTNLLLILPDESNNNAIEFKESPSGKFVECLKLIHDIDYVAIPREVLDRYSVKSIDNTIYNQGNWIRKIADSSSKILIVDESQVKGGTYKTIDKILSFLNKRQIGYFPLIDLNPKLTKEYAKTEKEMVYLNLYEFQLS